MIYKSYLVESNIDMLKNKIALFYGENIGLLDDFKSLIKNKKKGEILKFTQDDILQNPTNFENEIANISLFDQYKIFLINEVNDKILNIIQEIKIENKDVRVFLFAKVLEKKSKLRSFFEKSSNLDIVACYQDNELNLKNIIIQNLKNFKGVTQDIIKTIINNCSNDRAKLNNELHKIKIFFDKKNIDPEQLEELLNLKQDDDFNSLKNTALCGLKEKTNEMLSTSLIDLDKSIFYLTTLNLRLIKLKELTEKDKNGLESAVNEIKPPIFWKEKPFVLNQAKLWNARKINKALDKIYHTEIRFKTNSNANKSVIFKNLIVDICNLANAA